MSFSVCNFEHIPMIQFVCEECGQYTCYQCIQSYHSHSKGLKNFGNIYNKNMCRFKKLKKLLEKDIQERKKKFVRVDLDDLMKRVNQRLDEIYNPLFDQVAQHREATFQKLMNSKVVEQYIKQQSAYNNAQENSRKLLEETQSKMKELHESYENTRSERNSSIIMGSSIQVDELEKKKKKIVEPDFRNISDEIKNFKILFKYRDSLNIESALSFSVDGDTNKNERICASCKVPFQPKIVKLACGHCFHQNCIQDYVHRNLSTTSDLECPCLNCTKIISKRERTLIETKNCKFCNEALNSENTSYFSKCGHIFHNRCVNDQNQNKDGKCPSCAINLCPE